jgi:hypothetical protein
MLHRTPGCEALRRRDFLNVGALSLMGLGLPGLLASESTRRAGAARNVILIWLGGGPSTIDMWDLKPEAEAATRGEFKPISTSAEGMEICEHLPKMAQQMNRCTLIRSVSHTVAEHQQGAEHVLTGNPINPAMKYPSIGSVVANQTRADSGTMIPAYIDLTGFELGGAGYLGSAYNPFVVDRFQARQRPDARDPLAISGGFTVSDLSRRQELLAKVECGFRRFDNSARADEMSAFQQQALDILTAGKTREALDVFREKEQVVQRYSQSPLGLSSLAARRLVQAGVRFVTIGMNGWDTHSQNFSALRNNLLPELDSAMSALIEDLSAEGLLDETIVYCLGEFGRTPNVNAQGGRDHWSRAMSVLIAGGGFKAGFVYGSTGESGFEPDSDACSPADVNGTLLNQLGITPETRLMTRSGRPMPMFRNGTVLRRLIVDA